MYKFIPEEQVKRLRLEVARLKAQLAALAPEGHDVPEFPLLPEAWDETLKARQLPSNPTPHCRSSSLGEPCLRRLYFERVGAKKKPMELHVCGIFHVGNELEEDVKRGLMSIGYQIDRAQSTLEYHLKDKLLFRGHPDGILSHPFYPGRTFVLDIKSCSSNIWRQLPDDPWQCTKYLEDAIDKPWLVKYPYQVASYLLAEEQKGINHTGGILAFANKDNSRIKCAFLRPDERRAKWIVDRCKKINVHVESKMVPPEISNPKACKLCPYFEVECEPTVYIEKETLVDETHPSNVDVVKHLKKHVKMKAEAKEFTSLDKDIKARFKKKPAGTYLLQGVAKIVVREPSKSGSIRVDIYPVEE